MLQTNCIFYVMKVLPLHAVCIFLTALQVTDHAFFTHANKSASELNITKLKNIM